MSTQLTYLPYNDTGYFSKLVTDYLDNAPGLEPFYTYNFTAEGLDNAVNDREKFPVDRTLLANVLARQYADLQKSEKVHTNLELLKDGNTYTVCTAHQPNLLTGYLYFIYKIVHAIKLAEELKKRHPEKNFVPVYYMGSEDNDLDELGVFKYNEKKYVWDANGQTGAVGRMDTQSVEPLLNDFFKVLGPPGENYDELVLTIKTAYLHNQTIAGATQYLVNELFGALGLIVLNPDEAAFKKAFIPVIKDELLHSTAFGIVNGQIEKLSSQYKAQAHPREINLFYLKDDIRERIERHGNKWVVLNTTVEWNEQEMLTELEEHPDRFSPNVILRGAFQETILPDVAFIGGGSEVAYWLQLKTLFEHYHIFYPSIHLRQSVQWIDTAQVKLKNKLGLSVSQLFLPEEILVREYIGRHSNANWKTDEELAQVTAILNQVKKKVLMLDPTLKASAEAALAKMKHQLEILEKKMLRAEKKKMQIELSQIARLKSTLFPGRGLQERVENFSGYYIRYGKSFVTMLNEAMKPLEPNFLVIEINN